MLCEQLCYLVASAVSLLYHVGVVFLAYYHHYTHTTMYVQQHSVCSLFCSGSSSGKCVWSAQRMYVSMLGHAHVWFSIISIPY